MDSSKKRVLKASHSIIKEFRERTVDNERRGNIPLTEEDFARQEMTFLEVVGEGVLLLADSEFGTKGGFVQVNLADGSRCIIRRVECTKEKIVLEIRNHRD